MGRSRNRRFYLDLIDWPEGENPVAGDLLVGPVAVYEVLDSWPTETRRDVNRWTLTVRRMGDANSPTAEMAGRRLWRYRPRPR